MTENKTETFEGVDPSNVREGDRLQFFTRETGFNGRGLHSRTGVVVKVTEKTVRVDCGDSSEGTAVLRKYQPEWNSRDVRRVVTKQPATARTAADFPKGTRVTGPDGRMGTVNGVDVGHVTNTEHVNYGREYVGVSWDKDEKCPWGDRGRPFVDELVIESTTQVDVEEVPFQPGERVVYADGRCFEFVSVNPEDSSRILVARPRDGRVVSWLLSECRAENETEIAARHGETDKLHTATCQSQGDCTSHNVKDRRGGRGLELGSIPTCEPGLTYGAWSEGAGGFIYSGDCATEAANYAADELRTLAKDDDTDTIQILAVCPDHEEQPKNGCEDCNTTDDEE